MTTMRRCLTTALAFACFSVIVRADVTIVATTTIEGGIAAMAGGNRTRTMTTRVKGLKQRVDVEGGPVSVAAIADLPTKQVIVLNAVDKIATVELPARSTRGAGRAVVAGGQFAVMPTGVAGHDASSATSSLTTAVAERGTGRQMPSCRAVGLKMVAARSGRERAPAADYLAFSVRAPS